MTSLPPPPLAIADMPAGTRLHAGMGMATILPSLDFETYSEAGYCWDEARNRWASPPGAAGTTRGLSVVGAAVYAEHPSTEILSLAYDLRDGRGVRLWTPAAPEPHDLLDYIRSGGLLQAWNTGFERWIWKNQCVAKLGWPAVQPEQWRCAMARARAHALPGALGKAGEVLKLQVQKDKRGGDLLKQFAMPRTPTQTNPARRNAPEGEDFEALLEYNRTDVLAESEAAAHIPDLEGEELEFWLADQAINERGVHIDRRGVSACIAIVQAAHKQYNQELYALTDGAVARASEIAKLKDWLGLQGVYVVDGLDEDAVAALLDGEGMPAPARRALEIRAAVGSASVKKVYAMSMQCANDDRLHDLFTYHGARTGRPTGNGPQPTNLPKVGPSVMRCDCGRHFGATLRACPWCGAAV